MENSSLGSRPQYNDRRKYMSSFCKVIRERMVQCLEDGCEEYFSVDSKSIEVCRLARARRYKMRKNNNEKASATGYCTS